MKMLKKGFSSQARLAVGLQHVMSAREIIPPQKKLNTDNRPEAETGNTFFMPVNAVEEGLAAKSVQLSSSCDESEMKESFGIGVASQDGRRQKIKTSRSTTGGKHCSSAKVKSKKSSQHKGVAVVGIDMRNGPTSYQQILAQGPSSSVMTSSFKSQSSNQSKPQPQKVKQYQMISEITGKEEKKKKPVIRQ